MSENGQAPREQEPIGIVISRGRRVETPPRVSAYIYAEADEVAPETEEPKAA